MRSMPVGTGAGTRSGTDAPRPPTRVGAPLPGVRHRRSRARGDPVAPHAILTVTALLFLLYGLLSRRLARGVITAPMLAVAAGVGGGAPRPGGGRASPPGRGRGPPRPGGARGPPVSRGGPPRRGGL